MNVVKCHPALKKRSTVFVTAQLRSENILRSTYLVKNLSVDLGLSKFILKMGDKVSKETVCCDGSKVKH